ncbi:MAG TPA: DUF1592 domain-containing protein [Steroidobacteraceae bacterium]
MQKLNAPMVGPTPVPTSVPMNKSMCRSPRQSLPRPARMLAAGLLTLALAAPSMGAFAASTDANSASQVWLRLSPSQYKQVIRDIFGPSIAVTGRFEPEIRDKGLMAIGSREASVTDAGLERYDALARGIAAQVVDERNRATLIPCKPRSATSSDDKCAQAFVTSVGRLLYRRQLSRDEIKVQVKVAASAAQSLHDFYGGLGLALSNMLVSPDFLFRFQRSEPDPAHPGQYRLDAYSKASNLSFFLWNSMPDEQLLQAAESGAIHTKQGLDRQVDRMLSSPNVEIGVRAFFADLLGFSDFETLSKDPTFFPRYTLKVKEESQEQTLRTIVDHLLTRQGDYRDLLTTPHTFMTVSLAALYGVPLVDTSDNGQPDHWQAYTYPPDDPRAGLLAQASFVALYSPAGRSSPTGRGKALRETLLCQNVPPPPANVDFKFVQDTSNPKYKTTRDRLTAHRSDALCAGCHKITDPIGLALENFDGAGGYRTTENGAVIDTSGELSGHKFTGPVGLAKALHDDPAVTSCVAKKAYAFGSGRMPLESDPGWAQIKSKFSESHYNFVALLRQIASSDVFYSVPPQQVASAADSAAAAH